MVKDLAAKVGKATVNAALNTAVGPAGPVIKAASVAITKATEEIKQSASRSQSQGVTIKLSF